MGSNFDDERDYYDRRVFDETLKKMGLGRLIGFDADAAADRLRKVFHDEVGEASAVKPEKPKRSP